MAVGTEGAVPTAHEGTIVSPVTRSLSGRTTRGQAGLREGSVSEVHHCKLHWRGCSVGFTQCLQRSAGGGTPCISQLVRACRKVILQSYETQLGAPSTH